MKNRGVAVLGAVLALGCLVAADGMARFALGAGTVVQVPGKVVAGFGLVLAVAASVAGRKWSPWVGLAGLLIGFIGWVAVSDQAVFLVPNQLSGTLAYATPLVLGGLGGLLCERSGVVNIAIEGQFMLAAFAAVVVASLSDSLAAGLLAGTLAGVVVGALLGFFSIRLLVNQVMLGIVLNLLIGGLTGFWFMQFVVGDALRFNSAPVLDRWVLVGLAAVAVSVVWAVLNLTKWGLRVQAVGEHPRAAASAGVDVRRVRWQAVLAGGALAGLGGCYFTLGTVGQFSRNITSGYGFVALAALIMGRWRPLPTALAALGFGFVMQLAGQTQAMGTPINSQLLLIMPYVATIVAVAGIVGKVRAPAASGQNYEP